MLPTILRTRQAKEQNFRYKQNAGQAKNWLSAAESKLNSAGTVLGRLRELMIRGGSDSLDQSARDALYKEWKTIKSELLSLANAEEGERFLFAGSNIHTKPFEDTPGGMVYHGDGQEMMFQVSSTTQVAVNLPDDALFTSLLNHVEDIGPALQSGDDDLNTHLLEGLDDELDKILAAQAELGARMNQVEVTHEGLLDREVALEELQSQLEDADLSKVIIRLKESESVYQAALQTGARLIQNTLLDYLR
jgi:flagellar hook-associated protein 3 FlgL